MTPGPIALIDNRRIGSMLRVIQHALRDTAPPVVTLIAEGSQDPYRVLISTLLSARTKDETTAAASHRLFKVAPDPEALAQLAIARLEKLIFPVGFYRTKAKNLKMTGRMLRDEFGGVVPDTIDELVQLPGVGRKTANLVLTEAFKKHAICVDTHVHRICNLWGYVRTNTPEQTEWALRDKLPKRYWIDLNKTLVSLGQQICVPLSPKCTECPLAHRCPRLGVERSR